jgi:hypothetical protein
LHNQATNIAKYLSTKVSCGTCSNSNRSSRVYDTIRTRLSTELVSAWKIGDFPAREASL